ncbi:universal stress protein [Haloarchaeobius amylolyticus]|uniref:Universal stress protein n=1 Tax=Haloarchaeobius amylolyticus TaxID=1198296 RepID=A0ABD6BE57_9EURY
MYTQILFPTDGSEGSAAAFDHVLEIADAHGATVHVLNVADTTKDSVLRRQGETVDTLVQEGETIVSDAEDRAQQRGIETVAEVRQGVPANTIVDYAASHDVDLVVMPTHGRQGLERVLLGSTTERVIRQAETPTLTIRPDTDAIDYPYRSVLVPTDGSESARDALTIGVDVATTEGAALHLLSVVTTATLGVDVRNEIQLTALEESATQILEDASAFATDAGVEPVDEAIEFGPSIPREIRTYIDDHDIDLVVVGTHGRTGLDRYLLGSVTDQLVRTSPVPVLTVRGDRSDAE